MSSKEKLWGSGGSITPSTPLLLDFVNRSSLRQAPISYFVRINILEVINNIL